MYQKIFFALVLFGSSISYAKGRRPPRMSAEAQNAIESCGLSLPEKGQRPSREEREAIKSCLDEAGVERPRKRRHQRRYSQNNQESFESQSID